MFFAVLENVAGPRDHAVLIWQGEATSRIEALHFAAQADPRVDIKWMRVRHELDFTLKIRH
jgi:hypothetical protein